ncbi:hypothetical protein NPIL_698771 [Nephila pilipes]|uniref:Uncharacterized protein n=1 Tax=Nephila pilipes TaxID=299642 RepID=A0A8X6PLD5_NEPPI|nr:hypothetical protein NPIL_698771 [Nephila pilipes]
MGCSDQKQSGQHGRRAVTLNGYRRSMPITQLQKANHLRSSPPPTPAVNFGHFGDLLVNSAGQFDSIHRIKSRCEGRNAMAVTTSDAIKEQSGTLITKKTALLTVAIFFFFLNTLCRGLFAVNQDNNAA